MYKSFLLATLSQWSLGAELKGGEGQECSSKFYGNEGLQRSWSMGQRKKGETMKTQSEYWWWGVGVGKILQWVDERRVGLKYQEIARIGMNSPDREVWRDKSGQGDKYCKLLKLRGDKSESEWQKMRLMVMRFIWIILCLIMRNKALFLQVNP